MNIRPIPHKPRIFCTISVLTITLCASAMLVPTANARPFDRGETSKKTFHKKNIYKANRLNHKTSISRSKVAKRPDPRLAHANNGERTNRQRPSTSRQANRTPRTDRSSHSGRREHGTQSRTYRRDNRGTSRHYKDRRNRYRRPYRQSYRNTYRPFQSRYWTSPFYRPYQSRSLYRTNYRSGLNISFAFGSPNYSRYRWVRAPYALYRPGYVSYGHYVSQTRCEYVYVEANHYDHTELVRIKQCYNPWDGEYIVQGSEQIVDCHY